ncbi:hypothetical protein BGAL_0448g00070 [Botrytis galanthina]|uniref:Uncharacterized protein n=1 Tax=Botrytis galanthina TaxID=278940 RepID=A0A4S8QPZ2_9HELO|nr:hypothetical protein BGAL_0448g00070 [Botrytis galanthina]
MPVWDRSASDPAPTDMTQTSRSRCQHLFFIENSLATRDEEEGNLETLGKHDGKCMTHCLLSASIDTGAPDYTEAELAAEASLLVVVRTNTAAVTKVGFCFYVLRSPSV